MNSVQIISTGLALPSRVVTNDDLAAMEETSDEWIMKRTGIHERRFTADGETANSLAREAARKALEKSGISLDELGAVIVATLSGDYSTPSVATQMQERLGLPKDIPFFDMNAACSGFPYAIEMARSYLVANPTHKYALVTGVEELSKLLDKDDRSTNILFGDGAGSVVVSLCDDSYAQVLGAESSLAINCLGAKSDESYIRMDGKEVFRFAVRVLPYLINTTLEKAGLTADDIDWFVCHQANKRIVDHVVKAMKLPKEKFYCNIDRYGNTSGASIPICLAEMDEKGLLHEGDTLILAGFGSGLTWGSCIVHYR